MSATSMPPVTKAEVVAALVDPTFTVYICVAAENSKAWKVALFAFGYLTRLRIYRATSHAEVIDWLDPSQQNGSKPVGIVFGFDDKVDRYLGKAEAEDAMAVVGAIDDAR